MRNELGLLSKKGKGGCFVYVSPVKITPDVREAIKQKARQLGMRRSDFVRMCIDDYLAKGS